MGVTVYYDGKLARGTTIDELVAYIEEKASKDGMKTKRPSAFSDRGEHRFRIPKHVIERQEDISRDEPNKERIFRYAQNARMETGHLTYAEVCRALNERIFRQVGVYLWVHEKAEPLRFVFVEGETGLAELSTDAISCGPHDEPITYVRFQREFLATKTGYEYDQEAHRKTLAILREVNSQFFNGMMRMRDPE